MPLTRQKFVIMLFSAVLLAVTTWQCIEFNNERCPDTASIAINIPEEWLEQTDDSGEAQIQTAASRHEHPSASDPASGAVKAASDAVQAGGGALQAANARVSGGPAMHVTAPSSDGSRHISSRREIRFSTGFVPPPPPLSPSLLDGTVPPSVVQSSSRSVACEPSGTLADNMVLSGVIDNRAIFKINRLYSKAHRLPSSIALGPGDEFEGVSVVTIDGDTVTVSEGIKRAVKTIAALR